MAYKTRTPEEYALLIYDKYGDKYTLLSEYTRSRNKINVRHNVCGTVWWPNAGDLAKKPICPTCGKSNNFKSITKTPEQFEKEFYDVSNGEYELLTPYHRSKEKVEIKHKKCGHIFKMTPEKYLSGQRCPNCRKNKKKTEENFKEQIFDLYGDEFELVGEYVNTYTKTELLHKKCGNKIKIKPSDFLMKKTYCKFCNQSALENIISNSLLDLGIDYDVYKEFDGLVGVGGNNLSYDFYFIYNGTEYVIEGQGEQHYRPVKHFGDEEKFKKQQEHDKRKREFAKLNNLCLIEIPYWDYKNTKKIIESHLSNQVA